MQKPDLAHVKQLAIGIIWCDDDKFFMVECKVPLDQRQGAFADRAKADHHDGAVEAGEQC